MPTHTPGHLALPLTAALRWAAATLRHQSAPHSSSLGHCSLNLRQIDTPSRLSTTPSTRHTPNRRLPHCAASSFVGARQTTTTQSPQERLVPPCGAKPLALTTALAPLASATGCVAALPRLRSWSTPSLRPRAISVTPCPAAQPRPPPLLIRAPARAALYATQRHRWSPRPRCAHRWVVAGRRPKCCAP